MAHLLKDWPAVSRRFRQAERVLLLFDYDGTLTPIAPRPELAVLSTEARQLLEELSGNRRYVVGIVSGRALADVREKVSLRELVYAGNHGLEIDGPGIHFLHPLASQLKPVLGQIYRDLCHRMADYPGVIIEDKGLTLSVHYRMASAETVEPVRSGFGEVLSTFEGTAPVKVTSGKMVLEVRPDVDWNKGRAIARLMEAYPEASLTTFFGDDVTDEDGFGVVQNAGGLAVFVGPQGQPTRAQYRVDSPQAVTEFLHLVIRSESIP